LIRWCEAAGTSDPCHTAIAPNAVLDPFSGAATTGLAARRLGRTSIGIDLSRAFHDIGLRRLGLLSEQPARTA